MLFKKENKDSQNHRLTESLVEEKKPLIYSCKVNIFVAEVAKADHSLKINIIR